MPVCSKSLAGLARFFTLCSTRRRCDIIRDQTRPPAFCVNPAYVSLLCPFRRAEFAPAPAPDSRPAKFFSWRAERLARPKSPRATERHTAPLRPACRSIPAARFRHFAELNGATKAPLVSPLLPLPTQRRSRRNGLAHAPAPPAPPALTRRP